MNHFNQGMKVVWKSVVLFFLIVVLATLALVASYQLPEQPIVQNVRESMPVFEKEDHYPVLFGRGSKLDNYTDALILSESICFRDRSLDAAMRGASYRAFEYPIDSLKEHFENSNMEIWDYPHYWHGNLTIIRPLLLFFNYQQIRILNGILIIGICVLFGFFAYKKGIKIRYILLLYFALLLVKAFLFPYSLQFSCMFYLTMIALFIMLKFHSFFMKNNRYIFYFLICGMITSYFDYLTTPLLSLGIPLIFLLILCKEKQDQPKIVFLTLLCIVWAIGYFGMYFSKWVIGTLTTDMNMIQIGWEKFFYRVNEVDKIPFLEPIIKNGKQFGQTSIFLFLVLIVILCGLLIPFHTKDKKVWQTWIFPLSCISCFPFIWYMVLKNHSVVHAWFTYRSLAITIFGILVMLAGCIDMPDQYQIFKKRKQ